MCDFILSTFQALYPKSGLKKGVLNYIFSVFNLPCKDDDTLVLKHLKPCLTNNFLLLKDMN